MDVSDSRQQLIERAIASSFSGAFFQYCCSRVIGHFLQTIDSLWLIPPTGAVAGAVVVNFYSAMRVALVGAIVVSIVSLVYFIDAPTLPAD